MRTAAERHREWTRPPAEPIRYRLRDRWADRRHGRRDGQAGVPEVTEGATGDTPWAQALRRLTAERINAEFLVLQQELAVLIELRAVASSPVEALRDRMNRAALELTEADKAPDLSVRRLADARHPEYVATGRRRAEGVSRRARAARDFIEAQRRLGETVQTVAALDQEIQRAREVARLRAERVWAHGCRRLATYRQHLVRTHRLGPQLNEQCPSIEPELPTWPWEGEEGRQP